MSSARFARLVQDAYNNNDLQAARDAYHDWQVGHCLYPSMQTIIDSHTQTLRKIQIPCGKCYHCMETKINEWCTRMYAHAEDFKRIYFVTLTYRSITDPNNQVNRLLLSKLTDAVWNQDNFNATNHLSYNPCLLQKSHYQKFLKRLRKNTGLKDLTYVLSGEYGSKYGRPHFHMILFTNGELTKDDIIRAWSVCLWKDNQGNWSYRTNQCKYGTSYNFPIGRVDFNDLVTNGTFNTTAKVRVDGTYMNAANCFSYVCKYVCKRDKINYDRVNLAYNNTHKKVSFVDCYGTEIPYDEVEDFVKLTNTLPQPVEAIKESLKNYQYEKTIFAPNSRVFKYGLCYERLSKKQGIEFVLENFPNDYLEYRDKFSPFCEFSRGVPIGSVYAKRNIHEFTQGVFTKPLLQNAGFVVPSYFRTKATEYEYGLREERRTCKGKSYAFGGLVDLLGQFKEFDENSRSTHYDMFSLARDVRAETPVPLLYKAYLDKSTGEHITFDRYYAYYSIYDRKQRKFITSNRIPTAEFIRFWIPKLQKELQTHARLTRLAKSNLQLQERGLLMLTDLGEEPRLLRKRFDIFTSQERKNKQILYDNAHVSVE